MLPFQLNQEEEDPDIKKIKKVFETDRALEGHRVV